MGHYMFVTAILFALLANFVLAVPLEDKRQRDLVVARCKTTPFDPDWPEDDDWTSLNKSIGGALIRTAPVASSCWPGNPFNSPLSCEQVEAGWNSTDFHAALPESIDFPIYANNSCLPPGFPGYSAARECKVGGLPQYVVNATDERQIAMAMSWAAHRNIRIVVKGTGHDLAGRSSGAYSLSIWTHHFDRMEFHDQWPLPSGQGREDVLIVGSGRRWREVYAAADKAGKALVGGGDGSVGLGGHIQGGGHGPLSSTYGLAADQIIQAIVITTDGRILTSNEAQHQDLLWAIRGGSGGIYGVVTEYVLKAYPAVSNVTLGTLLISAVDHDNASINAVWNAGALLVSSIPDLMDAGLTGTVYAATGLTAMALNPAFKEPPPGIILFYRPFSYNSTPEAMNSLLDPLLNRLQTRYGNTTLSITRTEPTTYPSFLSWFTAFGQTQAAGTEGLISSRLLGRPQLSSLSQPDLLSYMRRILKAQNETIGSVLVLTMTAGRGPASVPANMRGSLNPAWRRAYVHAVASGAVIDPTATPKEGLAGAAKWLNEEIEPVWRKWAAGSGAYFNEANTYDEEWMEDFYGESYDGLVQVKNKYDESESLYVGRGVGSEGWTYDLDTGKLCRSS